MKRRAGWKGYDINDNHSVSSKYKSFQDALKRSYQAEYITLNEGTDKEAKWRCLINPSRLTEQFDKKVISIDFESEVREGTIFYWDRTKEHWIINLQQHTEEAYFRGSITRCNYEIDVEGKPYWAAVAGPNEVSAQWKNVHKTLAGELNYSMHLQVTKDSKTINFFTRHQIIKVKMFYRDVETDELLFQENNWRVVATDKYSSDNVIDVYVDEWYNNTAEDIRQEQEQRQRRWEESRDKGLEVAPHIEGPHEVNVFDSDVSFAVVGLKEGQWKVSSKKVKIKDGGDPTHCYLDILMAKSGDFSLSFVSGDKEIIYPVRVKSF
jgi:hypothetical protein